MAKRAELQCGGSPDIRINSRSIIATVITRLICFQMPFGTHF